MKNFKYLLMLLLGVVMSFAFVACSDDDDDSTPVVGTWYVIDKDSYGSMTTTITFHKDGNGTINQKGDWGSGSFNYNMALTYHMTTDHEGVMTISEEISFDGYNESYDLFYFVVEGSKIYIYESPNYSERTRIATLTRK